MSRRPGAEALQARIAEGLLPLTRSVIAGSAVRPPHPYVRRHLVEHAAAGGVLDVRFLSEEFLTHVDAPRLARLLRQLPPEQLPSAAAEWLHLASSIPATRHMTSTGAGFSHLGRPSELRSAHVGAVPVWVTRWTQEADATGVAVAVRPDGRSLALTLGDNGTVRVWDGDTGSPVGAPLTGHAVPVTAIAAVVPPDGRPVAVTGDKAGVVQVWDLDTGARMGDPVQAHRGVVSDVQAVVSHERVFIATMARGQRVAQAWELRDDVLNPKWSIPLYDPGEMTATVLPDGCPVALIGEDEFVTSYRLDDAGSGVAIMQPGNIDEPIAAVELPNAGPVLVRYTEDSYEGSDGIEVWGINGDRIGEPFGHFLSNEAVALATSVLPDGRPAAFIAGSNTVRIVDLATRSELRPMLRLPFRVSALAVHAQPDRVGVVVSGPDVLARINLNHTRLRDGDDFDVANGDEVCTMDHARPVWLDRRGDDTFIGRSALMSELVAYRDSGDPQSLIVAGSAGCGKSAVLRHLANSGEGSVPLLVRATGRLPHEVLDDLLAAALPAGLAKLSPDLPITAETAEPLPRLQMWWRWVERQRGPMTVIIDELDRAVDPEGVLHDVLARLPPPKPSSTRVRLVVGVRVSEQLNEPGPARPPLADRAEEVLRARRLRIDASPWFSEGDLIEYVDAVLGHPWSRYHSIPDRHETVNAIAAWARSYRDAKIAVTRLTSGADNLDHPSWRYPMQHNFGSRVVELLWHDLRVGRPSDRRARAVGLLRALAFAGGRGLPRAIWTRVADAVVGQPGFYTHTDIHVLLRSGLRNYIDSDHEDSRVVYSIRHDALNAALRDRWEHLL